MLEGERLSLCHKKKQNFKDEGIKKNKNSQAKDATAFELPWTRNQNRTESNPKPNQTRPGLAWQQVADAAAAAADEDHEDHRRVS